MKKFTDTIEVLSTACCAVAGLLGAVSMIATAVEKTSENVKSAIKNLKSNGGALWQKANG